MPHSIWTLVSSFLPSLASQTGNWQAHCTSTCQCSAHRLYYRTVAAAATSAHPYPLSSPEGGQGRLMAQQGMPRRGAVQNPSARTDGGRPRDTNYIQGLELLFPDPPGPECQAGYGALVVLYPAILRDECINDFLHGQVGDELFLGQRAPGHGVKVAHTLQQQSQSVQPPEYASNPSPKAHPGTLTCRCSSMSLRS